MDAEAQRKITGPWLWMIAPTALNQGGANSTNVDSLAVASRGSVTEAAIAANGANVGDAVGALVWRLGEISETGGDNVNDVINRIGLGRGDINDHSSYALITLESDRAQRAQMRVGSDDSVKIWLNGGVVHTHAIDRGAGDFQDTFQVDLKQGDNLLLVKVSERGGGWSMFVGINANVNAVYKPPRGGPTGVGSRTVVSVAPSSIALPGIGQQFTVNVKITGGKNVAGYQLTLRFDRTALRYVKGGIADYLVRPFAPPENVSANQVTLAATSLGVLSQGDGTLATITFEVLAVKTSTLTLTDVTLSNAQAESLPVHIESGQVERKQVSQPARDTPGRVSIQFTPNAYISNDNIVEPRGGNFSGEIPLIFTVWSKANTRMRNQTVHLTTDTGDPLKGRNIDVSLSATTIRTANSGNATAKATLTLEEASTGTKTVAVTARVADISKTLRLVVRQTAASLSVSPFQRNVTADDEILIQTQVKSRNGTPMPSVTVRFIESSNRIAFTATSVRTTTDGKANSTLQATGEGTTQFSVEASGLPRQTFNVTVVREIAPVDVPARIEILPTPDPYIGSNNIVEPRGGDFSGEIPLTFTVWSKTNTRMRNQTVHLTTDSSIDVSLSATIRTANSGNATAKATLTLDEASTGTKTVVVTARVADISETLRLVVRQTAASLSVNPFQRNVIADDEILIQTQVKSRNGTVMPSVTVRFIESSDRIAFTATSVRTGTDGKANSTLQATDEGTTQFSVEVSGLPRQTFNVTVVQEITPVDVPARIEILPTPDPYIGSNNIVEPRGGDFSGEIPLTFTVWSKTNTRMRNQTVHLTTDSSIDVSLSATIRTANSGNATAKATLTLDEASTGIKTVAVTARVADISETLRLVVRQTAASLSVNPFQRNVTADDETLIQTQVKSRNGTVMPSVTVRFIESSDRIAFTATSVRTGTDGKANSTLQATDEGTTQFSVEVSGLPRQTFNVTVVQEITPVDVPARIEILPTPDPYIGSNNIVEPRGGDFSGEIPLTFTVWSKTNTRMRNQTVHLTTDSSIDVSLSATIRTANSGNATAKATLTLDEASTGIKTVAVTARVADISETLRLVVRQTAASLSVSPFQRNVTADDEILIQTQVKSRNGTPMPSVTVGFGESSGLISFTSTSVRTNTEGRASSSLKTSAAGTAQFIVSVSGVQPRTFSITISPKISTAEIPARIEILPTPDPYIGSNNIVEPRGGDFSGEIPLTFIVWSKANTRMQSQTVHLTIDSRIDVSLSATTIQTANSGNATAKTTLTLERASSGIEKVVVTAKVTDVTGTLTLTVKQTAASLTIEDVESSILSGDARQITALVKSRNNMVMRDVPVRFKESSGLITFAATEVQTGTDGRAYSLLTTGGEGKARFSLEVPGIPEEFFNIEIVTQIDFKQQHYEFSSRQGTKKWYGWKLEHYSLKRKIFFPGEIVELLDVKATVTVKGQGRLEFIEDNTHYASNWIEVSIRAKEHREKPTKLQITLHAKFKKQGTMPGAPSAQGGAVPEMTTVLPNYPNPFNPETWIPYYLAEPAEVTLLIHSADGKLVRKLALGYQLAGFYRNKSRAVYWDGKNNLGESVASGIYFYTLHAGEFSKTHKMLVIK